MTIQSIEMSRDPKVGRPQVEIRLACEQVVVLDAEAAVVVLL